MAEKLSRMDNMTLNRGNNTGNILNIIGNDIELFEPILLSFIIYILPVYLPCAIGIVYYYIGPSGFVGFGIIFLHLLIVIGVSRITVRYRKQVVRYSDSRIKMITNLIEGIKIIKLYGW